MTRYVCSLEQLEKAKTADPVSSPFLFYFLNFSYYCLHVFLPNFYKLAIVYNLFAILQLWNASQLEMVHYGKMHGFMRQVTCSWLSFPFQCRKCC